MPFLIDNWQGHFVWQMTRPFLYDKWQGPFCMTNDNTHFVWELTRQFVWELTMPFLIDNWQGHFVWQLTRPFPMTNDKAVLYDNWQDCFHMTTDKFLFVCQLTRPFSYDNWQACFHMTTDKGLFVWQLTRLFLYDNWYHNFTLFESPLCCLEQQEDIYVALNTELQIVPQSWSARRLWQLLMKEMVSSFLHTTTYSLPTVEIFLLFYLLYICI